MKSPGRKKRKKKKSSSSKSSPIGPKGKKKYKIKKLEDNYESALAQCNIESPKQETAE
jgi:hypothetical protein